MEKAGSIPTRVIVTVSSTYTTAITVSDEINRRFIDIAIPQVGFFSVVDIWRKSEKLTLISHSIMKITVNRIPVLPNFPSLICTLPSSSIVSKVKRDRFIFHFLLSVICQKQGSQLDY